MFRNHYTKTIMFWKLHFVKYVIANVSIHWEVQTFTIILLLVKIKNDFIENRKFLVFFVCCWYLELLKKSEKDYFLKLHSVYYEKSTLILNIRANLSSEIM